MVKHLSFLPIKHHDNDGFLFSKDCEITFAPGIKVLEQHRDEYGITIITDAEILEVSATSIKYKNMENQISKKERLAMAMYDSYCEAVEFLLRCAGIGY